MKQHIEVMRLALDALLSCRDYPGLEWSDARRDQAIAALREALAEQQAPVQKRPQNCGTGHCSCIECPYEQPAQPQQEPFGYFRAEPFGWTDCAETDEGAIALYTRSPAQQEPLCAHCNDALVGSKLDGALCCDCAYTLEQRAALGLGVAAQQEPVAWECKAGGLKPLSQRLYEKQPDNIKRHYTRIEPPQRQPLTADNLKEPQNGERWHVVWWNESCRMMLPCDAKLDGTKHYKNGTVQFTVKKAANGSTGKGGEA